MVKPLLQWLLTISWSFLGVILLVDRSEIRKGNVADEVAAVLTT